MCETVPTKRVPGTLTDTVLAPIIRSSIVARNGEHLRVRITMVDEEFEEFTSILVGLEVCTIFTGEIFGAPQTSRVAYATEITKELDKLGHKKQAQKLLSRIRTFGFYVCKPGTFNLI